jgi:TRAP-type mannitol/chloroaromatic compound transport system substrate-binding protein
MNTKTMALLVLTLTAVFSMMVLNGEVVAADKVFKWKAQTYQMPGSLAFESQAAALEQVKKATGGRLDIKLHGVGTLVGPFEMFEACGKGLFQMVHNPDAYAAGLDPGMAVVFGPLMLFDNTKDFRVWFLKFGGWEIMKEAYAKHNVHFLGYTGIGAEPIMSKKPIKTIEDFKGLKIRTPGGMTSMLLAKMGASPVPLGGGEIYTALDTGVIDAAEFVTVSEDYDAGFHEVTEYILWPSPHAPVSSTNWGVNMDAWNELPDDLKTALEMMPFMADDYLNYWSAGADYEALKKMKEKGIEHTQLSPEDWKKCRQFSMEVAMEYREKSELAAKLIDSMISYGKMTGYLE